MATSGTVSLHLKLIFGLLCMLWTSRFDVLEGGILGFESECSRNGSARHIIDDQPNGTLVYRSYAKRYLACQWFIDGSSLGTNIFLNVSHLTGSCELQNCIEIHEGEFDHNLLLATLSGFELHPVTVVSSKTKLTVSIAASCSELTSFTATFDVLVCSSCHENNCSYSTRECDSRCPKNKCFKNSDSTDQSILTNHFALVDLKRSSTARAGHSAVLYNRTVWIFGGSNGSFVHDSSQGFDIRAEAWSPAEVSGRNPSARHLHSAVMFNDSFYILGGVDRDANILDDFWSFNFTTRTWTLLYNDYVPALAAHSATLVGEETFLFGGYLRNGTFSSTIYVWSYAMASWRTERPKNSDLDLVVATAGHSAIYYRPLHSLVVFGGFRVSSAAHYLFFYNIQEQVWTAISPQYGSNVRVPSSQLVFHQATLVGSYMVISGGYVANGGRSCQRGSVYFYHLECQVFLPGNFFEEKNLSVPEIQRFAHTATLFDGQLLFFGGIGHSVLDKMSSLQLPDFVTSNSDHCMKDYSKRLTCQTDPSCVWCAKAPESEEEGFCVGTQYSKLICGASVTNPSCPTLCPSLTHCVSCLSYRQDGQCSWCPRTAKCVIGTSKSRDDCTAKRFKDVVGWWSSKSLANLASIEHCQQTQSKPGLTVLLYYPDPDPDMPDEVLLVQTSVLSFHPVVRFPPNQDTGTLIAEMKGFIHPLGANPKSTWDTQLRMWMKTENSMGFEGTAQLWLSRDGDQKNVELVAESRGIFPVKTEVNRHDELQLFPVIDEKYFVKFVYQIRVQRGRLPPDFEVHMHLTWNGNSIITQPFDVRNLEPFSTDGFACSKYDSCMLCLADRSCGWCPSSHRCLSRSSETKESDTCKASNGMALLLSVDVDQCIQCFDIKNVQTCRDLSICLWDAGSKSCFRKSSVASAVQKSAVMVIRETDCRARSSCSGCIQSDGCAWCHSTKQCLPHAVLEVLTVFGYCSFWEDSDVEGACTVCSAISDCQLCLNRPSCGWCSKVVADPRHGQCLSGDIEGPASSSCPGMKNDTGVSLWSYGSCPDVDECALGTADCHPNATCINTHGHYVCECAVGYKGDGRTSCENSCDAACMHGRCSDETVPRIEPFVCICDLGWTGPQCDIDCGCNFHSTCLKNVTQCDQCYGNTEGSHCEKCVRGTFGNATADKGCLPCSCNGHADPNEPCDGITGRCKCQFPYSGNNCEVCPNDFYGDALNGGICYSRCRSRTVIVNATAGGLGNANDTPDSFCLWILISGKFDYFGDRLPISLTIQDGMELLCPNNSLTVTDGIPDFLTYPSLSSDMSIDDRGVYNVWESSGRSSSTISRLCGPLKDPFTVRANSGIVTIAFWRSSRFERFNATYFLESRKDRRKKRESKMIENGELRSRLGYSVQVVSNVVYLFGGLDALTGVSGDLWRRRIDVNWTVVDFGHNQRPLPRFFHASAAVKDAIIIHGGFVLNADRSEVTNDVWVFNTTTQSWKEMLPVSKRIPWLAGHTMTVVGDVIFVIGGAAGTFNDVVYTFEVSRNRWSHFMANGSRPVGLYGHSATYYPARNAIFVFGGYRFDLDRTGMSSMLTVLDLNRRRWILMPSLMQENPLTLRAFHAAEYVMEGNYMIVAGGRTPNNLFDQSLLIFRFRCNDWLDETSSSVTTLMGPSFVRFSNGSEYQLYILSGFSFTQPYLKSSRVPIIRDFCPQYATTGACLSVIGCGMCVSETGNGSFCFDNSGGGMTSCGSKYNLYPGIACDENLSVMRICREQTECRTCVAPWIGIGEDESRCQWCTNCGNGMCIARYESCESSLSCNRSNAVIREPGMCLDERCHAADCQHCTDSRPSCFWTRHFQRSTEVVKKFRKIPAFPWNCFPQELFQKIAVTVGDTMEASPPAECPPPCSRYDSCQECLVSDGSTGGFRQCVWSEHNKECLNPALVLLQCPLGNCGALLYGGSRDRCPKEPRTATRCIDCLHIPKAGWCAQENGNGLGRCLAGGLSGPSSGSCFTANHITNTTTQKHTDENKSASENTQILSTQIIDETIHTWHFLTCPTEDECLNGHHTCDERSEDCVNTLAGFNCTCKTGYTQVPDNTDAVKGFVCVPVCPQGCHKGLCVEPGTCECDFGSVGANCSTACQCNGHSACPSDHELTTCTSCKNNTRGAHCELCEEGFVGDARNGGKCQSCATYCNGHATICLTLNQIFNTTGTNAPFLPDNPFQGIDFMQIKAVLDRDPSSNMALCYNCNGNTTGYRCESCLPGFFRPPSFTTTKDECRACECNGHDNTCNPATGTSCKCGNNTATDQLCEGSDKKDLPSGVPCWTVQCSQCKEYFVGRPTNGHQCYRQMSVGEDYCFDPEIPRGRCLSSESARPLRQGRTVFFAVQPKYLNVDIRIYVDVSAGGIDLYISDQEDMFVVNVDKKNGFHSVQVDKKYMANSRGIDEVVDFHRATDTVTYVMASDPSKVVIVRDVRHRVILTIPYTGHDLKLSKFYVVIHGIGSPLSEVTRGRILFRQDQPHIDLFVFFSVFFSCFFLFLAVCVVLWKFKQIHGLRQNRQRVAIEMQTMARRPFATVFLVLDKKTGENRIVNRGHGSGDASESPISQNAVLPGDPFNRPSISTVEPPAVISNSKTKCLMFLTRRNRNDVNPQDGGGSSSPSNQPSSSGDSAAIRMPIHLPVAFEVLQDGGTAVATYPLLLPECDDIRQPRFCMASTLVSSNAFSQFGVKT